MSISKRLTVVLGASLLFSAHLAIAQTMGEYGGVTAHAAAGAGASGSAMRPPEVHVNPVTTSRGTSKTYEISGQMREDDSPAAAKEKDDDSAKGDDWQQVTNQ